MKDFKNKISYIHWNKKHYNIYQSFPNLLFYRMYNSSHLGRFKYSQIPASIGKKCYRPLIKEKKYICGQSAALAEWFRGTTLKIDGRVVQGFPNYVLKLIMEFDSPVTLQRRWNRTFYKCLLSRIRKLRGHFWRRQKF